MAGFGKATEIRKDPNADRGKWIEPVIENIKHAASHPIDTLEQSALGRATTDPQELTDLLMGLGMGSMKVSKKAPSPMSSVVKEYEAKFGIPVKEWPSKLSREQLLEVKAAKDLESGAAEAALSKGSPKQTKAYSQPAVEQPEYDIDADSPIVSGLAKYRQQAKEAKAAQYFQKQAEDTFVRTGKRPSATDAKVAQSVPSEPTPEMIEEVGASLEQASKTPLEKLVNPKVTSKGFKRVKPQQAAIDTSVNPEMSVPQRAAATVQVAKKRTPADVKEEAFLLHEAKSGRSRDAWTPDDLDAARQKAEALSDMENVMGKPFKDFTPQDIQAYITQKYSKRTE